MIRALAWRSVTSRKLRAILNGLGIVLGVALIFSVLSLSRTIVTTFDELFSSVYGQTDLIVSGADYAGTVDESLLEKVRAVDGVDIAVPSISSIVTLIPKDGSKPGQDDQINVTGVNPGDEDLSGSQSVAGRGIEKGHEIALDESFAERKGIDVGDAIDVSAQTGLETFKVVELVRFGEGLDFGGQGFGAVPLDVARKVFAQPTGYGEIDIALKPGANMTDVRNELEGLVDEGTEVRTPSDISDDINSQIQGFNIILYFFSAMSLFVGGFLILNSFNMTVAQRMREIGMLRTLGGSRRMIARMFLLEAVLLGLIGSLLGIVLGLLLTKLMVSLVGNVGLPIGEVKYPPSAFIAAPVLGIAATLFGALRPALRAGRVPPIEAVLSEHRAKPLKMTRRLIAGSVLVALGLAGVFTLASSTEAPTPVVMAGAFGVIFLFSGVIMLGPVVVPALVRVLSWPLRKLTPIEGRLAADSSRGNPVRTASTASGLMIGIALVAAIGSLGSSFIGSVSDDLDRELKTDFIVQPSVFGGGGPQATISPDAADEIAALPGAKTVSGTRGIFLSTGYGKNYFAMGLDPATHAEFSSPDYVNDGAAVDDALATDSVTLPEALAKAKDTKVGDTIELKGPRSSKRLKVAAIQKGNSIEAQSIVMSNDNFFAIYGVEGYSQILVIAESEAARPQLQKSINTLVKREYPAFEALSNEQVKEQMKDQINQVFAIFYVIMAVAIIVSLLGVVNTLLMNVLERTREIGVLRAIGSGRWQVRRIIIQESLLLTSAGAVLGLIVGMALGYAFVKGIDASSGGVGFHPPVGVIFAVALLAVIFGVIAALLPARRAAKMNVIEAVSYE
ncbi:MAG: FtsX-like permease family protein [Actinobacteria bacterium]|nr:FtsX-like permease family protein [Actinomycetota bacterium]